MMEWAARITRKMGRLHRRLPNARFAVRMSPAEFERMTEDMAPNAADPELVRLLGEGGHRIASDAFRWRSEWFEGIAHALSHPNPDGSIGSILGAPLFLRPGPLVVSAAQGVAKDGAA